MDFVLPFTYTSSELIQCFISEQEQQMVSNYTDHCSQFIYWQKSMQMVSLSPNLPEQNGGYRLLGTDPSELGRDKGGDTEVWDGVTKKAEVVTWQKLAYSALMYFTLSSVTLQEIGKQSLCSARVVSKIKIFCLCLYFLLSPFALPSQPLLVSLLLSVVYLNFWLWDRNLHPVSEVSVTSLAPQVAL